MHLKRKYADSMMNISNSFADLCVRIKLKPSLVDVHAAVLIIKYRIRAMMTKQTTIQSVDGYLVVLPLYDRTTCM